MKIVCLFLISACLLISCSSGPSIWETKYKQAVSADLAEQNEEAINLALEAIENKPDYYEAHILLANLYKKKKDWMKAEEAFEKASVLDPLKAETFLGIGESYLQMAAQKENEEEAEQDYRKGQYNFSKVLDLPKVSGVQLTHEEQFLALLGKGICLLERTLAEEARTFLKQSLELDIDNTDARFYNARLHEIGIGPNKQSFSEYKKILSQNPKHLKTLLAMGDFYYKLDQNNKDAIRTYYKSFAENGGISKRVNEWLDANPLAQPVAYEPGSQVSAPVTVTPQVKVCQTCGRIYPISKESSVCDHDGGDLIVQSE